MFLIFGSIGFLWVATFIASYKEIRVTNEDDDFIIIPPKVCILFRDLNHNFIICYKERSENKFEVFKVRRFYDFIKQFFFS